MKTQFGGAMDNIFFEKIKSNNTGLKIAIKDSIDILGFKTVAGSRALMDSEPAIKNAEIIDLLEQHNCNIVGKTNLHELAFGITGINHFTGTPVNPRYPALIPGGSSSGSAAAVASGEVPVAIGTDTGGSIRMPAACCGVYGLKPTFGRVSRKGVWPRETTLDCVGPFAKDLEHIVTAMDMICPDFNAELAQAALQPKLAWLNVEASATVKNTIWEYLSERQLQGLDQVQAESLNAAYDAGMQVINYETWQAFGALTETGLLGKDIHHRLLKAASTSEQDITVANEIREHFRQEIDALLEHYDALLLPTLPDIPPAVADAENTVAFLNMTALIRPFNLSGHPAMTLPLESTEGNPVGLQLIGKQGEDEKLCAIARYLERANVSVNKEQGK